MTPFPYSVQLHDSVRGARDLMVEHACRLYCNKYTVAFQRSTRALGDAAEMRDQSRALTAYNGLVASCVECHACVARARIARVQ